MSKVPPRGICESDEGSAEGLGDGGGAGEVSNSPDGVGVGKPSDSAEGIPSGCDGDGSVVGTGLLNLKKESRALILSRTDCNLCFGIADEAITCTSQLRNQLRW